MRSSAVRSIRGRRPSAAADGRDREGFLLFRGHPGVVLPLGLRDYPVYAHGLELGYRLGDHLSGSTVPVSRAGINSFQTLLHVAISVFTDSD